MVGLSRSELVNLAVGLPVLAGLMAGLTGLGVGFGMGWYLKPAPPVSDEQVARLELDAFSPDQITFKCGQVRGEELKNANERIQALESERETYLAKVAALEKQVKPASPAPRTNGKRQTGPSRSAVQKELELAKRQLAAVQSELEVAEAERAQLRQALAASRQQLAQTEAALTEQVSRTKDARDDATEQAWGQFKAAAQLEICERGNRKKLGRCRETVQTKLAKPGFQRAFRHCLRSNQARPSVGSIGKGERLPRFAIFLDEESKVTKDWYVQLCDPTLPEARMEPVRVERVVPTLPDGDLF